MSIKVIATREDLDIQLFPGDTFHLVYADSDGTTTKVLKHTVKEPQRIDTALVIRVDAGTLGLEFGIGGIFGRREQRREARR